MTRQRLGLSAAIVLALCGFAITLDRVPVAWADDVWYASVARSINLSQSGTPSVLAAPARPVDHVRFYGPVFFQLVAASFRWLGFSLASDRLISLVGALVIAAAGLVIVRSFGGSVDRQLWASALLLLTPELGFSATNGRMDSTAVGLGMAALAVYLRGLARERLPLRHGLAAGLLLGAAALTTPRMLPFVFAVIFGSAAFFLMAGPRRRSEWLLLGAMTIGCSIVMGAWTVHAHGGPIEWARYLIAIVPAVGVDVAFSPTAVRQWQIEPWRIISSLAAILGAVIAGNGLVRSRGKHSGRDRAAGLALTITSINFIVVVLAFNLTFIFSVYFALPLLAVVLALPREWFVVSRSTLSLAGAVLFALDALVRGGKYGGAALTWAARDPERIERFVAVHVPAGSEVIGEPSVYFYAVEASHSRMRQAFPDNYADWATWAPRDTQSPARVGRMERRRFFLWPADQRTFVPPAEYLCHDRRLVAVYEPPPTHIEWMGRLAYLTGTPGYPKSELYELPPDCPRASRPTSRRTPRATQPQPPRSSRLATPPLASHSRPTGQG